MVGIPKIDRQTDRQTHTQSVTEGAVAGGGGAGGGGNRRSEVSSLNLAIVADEGEPKRKIRERKRGGLIQKACRLRLAPEFISQSVSGCHEARATLKNAMSLDLTPFQLHQSFPKQTAWH